MSIRITLVVVVLMTALVSDGFSQQGSSNVPLLGTFNGYPAVGYNDCWGYIAPDGREYALLGVRSGTSIIDITDPPDLVEVAFIPSPTTPWKDIKTYRQYAYVVTDGTGVGIQIIDLSTLPDTAHLVGTFGGPTFTSHNISIDTARGFLYVEGGVSVIRVFDLADPENPVEIPALFQGLVHCHDVFAENDRLFVSEGSSGTVGIYDVTNPAQPILIQRHVIPSAGYVHNAWGSPDGTLLMTTEETAGKTVKLWDITSFSAIALTDDYLAPEGLAHNVHLKGSYAYISHYKDGLRIVDLSNPSAIVEVGHFDTYDQTLPGNFHGAWGAYPFFRSGKVLISDMETGLYVVSFAGAVVSAENEGVPSVPTGLVLGQNHPNPFNPMTEIPFELPQGGWVSLKVYDLLGKEVAVLVNRRMGPGNHSVRFAADGLPSGLYVYRLETPAGVMARKMCYVR